MKRKATLTMATLLGALVVAFVVIVLGTSGQQATQVKKYGAEPLRFESVWEWENVHRPVIMNFFEQEVYGLMPNRCVSTSYEVVEQGSSALEGKAIRRQVALHIAGHDTPLMILIYLPANAQGPVPAFLGMNFKGNHQINPDKGIIKSPNAPVTKEELNGDPERGAASSRWPVEFIVESGYALVTIYRDNVDPDFDDGFQNGIHPLFYAKGQSKPTANQWGTIGAWAWSLSRVMDYLETDGDIDSNKVAVVGHSRLGKTALWAGATDSRFAITISNDSGCGGAALSIRQQGETVEAINDKFPHWFCDNYCRYNNNESELFVDQQGLIALIAPRPVYVASATKDQWADPEGEFLSALYASPVYELYGLEGISGTMPEADTPIGEGHVGYHLRTGKHDITLYDWQQYVRFADRHFGK